MEIFLPKENNDSETGKPAEWESISHASTTQKEAIVAFENYISKLSERLKEIDIKTSEYEKRNYDSENRIKKVEKASDTTFNLVIVGWFALLVVVIGLVFGYWIFVKDAVKNDDLKFGITQKISDQQKQLDQLKLCLSISKWLNPKCFEI